MTNSSIEDYLKKVEIPLRLSCISTSGWPVVLSLWYLFEEGHLFCATPQRAKVVTYLMKEPRCGFEVASDQPPYCGVRGSALATIEQEGGLEVLERLLERYVGGIDNPLAKKLLDRQEPEVAIRLEPLTYHSWNFTKRMTGSLDGSTPKICPD